MLGQHGGRSVQPAADAAGIEADGQRRLRPPNPLGLRNWRVRWRLLALVLIPTITAITFGGVRIDSARDTAAEFARVNQLAVLGGDLTALVNAVEDERDLTGGYLAAKQAGDSAEASSLLTALDAQYKITNGRLATVQREATRIGPAFPVVARTDLTSALSEVSALPGLRGLVHSEISALPMITNYTGVVSTMLAFDNDIAAGSSSPQLAQTVSALASLVQMEDQASQQRAVLFAGLLQGQFGLGELNALTTAESNEASDQATFTTTAANLPAYVSASNGTPAGLTSSLTAEEQFNDTVAGPDVDEASSIEQDSVINGTNGTALADGDAQMWFTDMSSTLSTIRQVEGDELDSITTQASSLESGEQNSETQTGVIVLTLLLLVLIVTIVVARSMTRPLRRLRADALDVAGRRLPEMVRRLSEAEGEVDSVEIEPIGIDSTDEIGEVARAFDQVHREAVRLAGDEALLRANLNAMFVNLSRRSQSLIERQLGIIDTLEESEDDPARLGSLFRLDHLATRMRRNSENLLVLAGHEAPRKYSQPVPLVDILRAAISEIEQFDRITLSVQPGIVVAGRAASDVVHLAAELVENATAFSPEETQVFVTGQHVPTGGVLLEITDDGLGISEQDLSYANWRLENPPVVDVAVSRRMGLFVVGRLAARHGVRVRLRHGNDGGLCALIWLPDTVAAETEIMAPFTGRFRPRSGPLPVLRGGAARIEPGRHAGAAQTDPVMRRAGAGANWFRRGGKLAGAAGATWASSADEGFRTAAAIVSDPVTGDTTTAGLPRRVPNANLVPGSAGEAAPETPSWSADAARIRMAGFARGGRRGRAAAGN
jgi:signal transduction histidine kinase